MQQHAYILYNKHI